MVPTAIVALSIAVSGDSLTPAQIRSFYPDLFPCNGVIADFVVATNPLGPFVRRTAWFYQAYLRYGHPRALVGPGCQERLQSDSTFNASAGKMSSRIDNICTSFMNAPLSSFELSTTRRALRMCVSSNASLRLSFVRNGLRRACQT